MKLQVSASAEISWDIMEGRAEREMLKVLVLDEEIPFPPDAGKRIRTWNLLKRLAQRHRVHLLCYGRQEDPAAAALRSAGIELHLVEPLQDLLGLPLYLRLFANLFSLYPYSVAKHTTSRFQRAFDELLSNHDWDLVQCEWTPYARFVRAGCNVPVLIASHNVESQIWERRAAHSGSLIGRLFFGLQHAKMKWFERRALLRAAGVTAVTADDAKTMCDWGVREVTLVPNGVDLEFYAVPSRPETDNEILSVASLDWFPNADSLEYFAAEIFPLVREKMANAVLKVVGRRPPESLRAKLSQVPGLDFIGEVPDVRPYLDRAGVVIVPLRIGGGSRLKILEALAAGKAVVSTSIGAEGLELAAGKHLLIADSADEFARRVVELLASRESRRTLGESGRAMVAERYGWDGIANRLESAWLPLSGPSQPNTLMSANAVARSMHGTS